MPHTIEIPELPLILSSSFASSANNKGKKELRVVTTIYAIGPTVTYEVWTNNKVHYVGSHIGQAIDEYNKLP